MEDEEVEGLGVLVCGDVEGVDGGVVMGGISH